MEGGVVTALARGRATLTIRAGTRSATLPVEVVSGAGYSVRSLGSFTPRGLNNLAWIVAEQGGQAALWREGAVTVLRNEAYDSITAVAVNDSGVVAGTARDRATGAPVAWTWRDGEFHRLALGAPPRAPGPVRQIDVASINRRGELVSTVWSGRGTLGAKTPLIRGGAVRTIVIPSAPSTANHGIDLNDAGQVIVQLAFPSSEAFLVTPASELPER